MKKLFAIALVLTMMLSMLTVTANAAAWDGTSASSSLKGEGTAASPYLVESADDLKYIQVQVNDGNTFEGKYFKQTADIDLNNKEWTPIGDRSAITLEGKMEGGDRVGDIYSGALLGWCQRTSTHENKIVLINCDVDVDMTLDTTGKGITGDIILGNVLARSGYISVINCTSRGDISVTADGSKVTAGGVVAYAPDCDVINCVNYGNVTVCTTAAKDIYCGGVIGATATSKIALKIDNCINYGTVFSDGAHKNYTGGVIGCSAAANCAITNCVNLADVTSKSTSTSALPYAGGVLGYTAKDGVSVANCYNNGKIVTVGENVTGHNPGGIVGVMNNASDTTFIKDCTTTTDTFKGWMAATNLATNCVVSADAAVITAAAKAIEDTITAATSATVNGAEFKFAEPTPITPPAPETTEPETTEPGSSSDTGDSALIFAIIAVISVAGVALVARRREI